MVTVGGRDPTLVLPPRPQTPFIGVNSGLLSAPHPTAQPPSPSPPLPPTPWGHKRPQHHLPGSPHGAGALCSPQPHRMDLQAAPGSRAGPGNPAEREELSGSCPRPGVPGTPGGARDEAGGRGCRDGVVGTELQGRGPSGTLTWSPFSPELPGSPRSPLGPCRTDGDVSPWGSPGPKLGVPRASGVAPAPSPHPRTYRWPHGTGEAVQAGGALEKKRGRLGRGWLQGPQPRAHSEGGTRRSPGPSAPCQRAQPGPHSPVPPSPRGGPRSLAHL